MIGNIANLFRVPEIRRRLGITLGFLLLYRVGWNIPIPGVDLEALKAIVGDDERIRRRRQRNRLRTMAQRISEQMVKHEPQPIFRQGKGGVGRDGDREARVRRDKGTGNRRQ